MTSLAERKSELRRAAITARRAAHAAGGAAAAVAARDHFLAGGFATGAGVVSGYRPIRSEIDPTPLMCALIDAGHRVAVPVIEAAGLPLCFREWTPDTPMRPGAFDAAVPASGDWLEPVLLVAPLVAFDAAGRRLGYGGGFYDRTLALLRGRRRTLAIGLAYAAQQVEALPAEPTDQPLDAIVTEAGVIRPAGAGHG